MQMFWSNTIGECAESCCEEMEATAASTLPGFNGHFAIPLPPKPLRPMSASSLGQSLSDSDSQSDSGRYFSQSSPIACRYPLFAFRGYQSDGSPVSLHSLPRLLPPIGVFWDIENCQVPKGRSAVAVAQVIRDRFFTGYREAEFLVVCDVKKENNQVIQELNDAQVNLIHVASTCKNAADEKLRQSIRRFADIYGSPAAIVLISGDINFAADITDLRHRKKIHVILLHKNNASEALILCASEHYNFSDLVEPLPPRGFIKSCSLPAQIVVSNLPEDVDPARLKSRLRQLSDNCGGRVGNILKNSATIRFSSVDVATRAQKRMEGENVYGKKITVSYPNRVAEREKQNTSPLKNRNLQGRKMSASRDENLSPMNSTTYQITSHALGAFNLLHSSVLDGWIRNGNAPESKENIFYTKPEERIPHQEQLVISEASYQATSSHITDSGLWEQSWTSNNCQLDQSRMDSGTEKTPEGYRRIRGIHKGDMAQCEDSTSLLSHLYKPVPKQCQRSTSPMTLASLNLASGPHEDFKWSSMTVGGSGGSLNRQSSYAFCSSSNESIMGNGCSKLRSRTPTPVSVPSTSPLNLPYDADSEESEHFFHPISNTPKMSLSDEQSTKPVELQVTNLDSTVGVKDMRRILITLFREFVMVQNVHVFAQSDGNLNAIVKVSSSQDARYAISKLQRRKIGLKRINISRASQSGPSPHVIRSQILTLLSEVPEHTLPLFKFCELFESRYLSSISMSDICKSKDVCTVTEGPTGRVVSLHPDQRNTPSPILSVMQNGQAVDLPFCPLHTFKPQPNKGWAEQKVAALPNVKIGLKLLSIRIHSLLQSHNGILHLSSLPICYKCQFEPLVEDESGVPLEHLVSCLQGVDIYQNASSVKYVRWLKAKPTLERQDLEPGKNLNPSLAGQLTLFSRELVDLLKTSPHCQLPFSRFIPAYHHHFGRQCRVADYGFTKLLELLEALPHVVQVLGEGNRRVVTLSHCVQVRRFTSDLLRILKLQANKLLMASEFPVLYQQVFDRPWDVTDYGVCELRDILCDLSDTNLMVVAIGDDLQISVPKREQTPEEREKTKQFGAEVDVIDGERRVTLTLKERLKVLADQVVTLINLSRRPFLTLSALSSAYVHQFGHSLCPDSFDCNSLEEVMGLIPAAVELFHTQAGPVVALVDHASEQCVQNILMEAADCKMEFNHLAEIAQCYFNQSISLNQLKNVQHVQVKEVGGKIFLQLSPLREFARNISNLLKQFKGQIPLSMVESSYLRMYGVPCQPAQLGFSSLGALLQSIPDVVQLRGRGSRRTVFLVQKSSVEPDVQPTRAKTVDPWPRRNGNNSCQNSFDFQYSKDTGNSSSKSGDASSLSDSKMQQLSDRYDLPEIVADLIDGVPDVDRSGIPDKVCFTNPTGGLWEPPWSATNYQSTVSDSSEKWNSCSALLLSPTSNLLPAYTSPKRSPHSYFLPHVVPPEPSELPLPQLSFTTKNTSLDETSSMEKANSSPGTPNRSWRKRRLAAQFNTPIDLP